MTHLFSHGAKSWGPLQGICTAIWYKSRHSSTASGLLSTWRIYLQAEDKHWIPDRLEPEGWWVRLLQHYPITYHQSMRGRLHTGSPSQMLSVKSLPQKSWRRLGFLSTSRPFPLLVSAINLSLLQAPIFWFVWTLCASGTQTWVWQHRDTKGI